MRSHGSRGGGFRSSGGSSSRSSSRSHFGGSGMSSRSHSRPSHSSISHNRPPMQPARHRGGVHIHVGGPSYHAPYYHGHVGHGGVSTFLTVLASFFIFIAIIGGILIGTDSFNKKVIVNDYEYYQKMIETAMNNSEYKTTAKITGKLPGPNDRWAIEYSIDGFFKQESFAVYSSDEIDNFQIGDTIIVAVEDPNSKLTDSIPFDYYEMPLDNDAEYIQYKKNITIHIIMTIGTGGAAIALLIFASNKRKKEKEALESENSSTSSTTSTTPQISTCKYCGGKITQGQSQCPNCGASISASDF